MNSDNNGTTETKVQLPDEMALFYWKESEDIFFLLWLKEGEYFFSFDKKRANTFFHVPQENIEASSAEGPDEVMGAERNI